MTSNSEEPVSPPKSKVDVPRILAIGVVLIAVGVLYTQWRMAQHGVSVAEELPAGMSPLPKEAFPQSDPKTPGGKAIRLMQEGTFSKDNDESRKMFEKVIELYGDEPDGNSRYAVAVSRVNLAGLTEDKKEKERLLDTVIADHMDTVDKDTRLAFHVVRAMNGKADLTKNSTAKRRIYDEVIERFRDSTMNLAQPEVIRAYYGKAKATPDKEEKIRLLAEAAGLYKRNPSDNRIGMAAACIFEQAALETDEDRKAALYDKGIFLIGDSGNEWNRQQAARARLLRTRFVQPPEARLAVLDVLVDSFRNSDDEYIRSLTKTALFDRANTILDLPDGIDRIRKMLAEQEPGIDSVAVVKGLFKKAKSEKDYAAQVKIYGDIIELFGDSEDEKLRPHLLDALVSKARAWGDAAEKIALYDKAIALAVKGAKDKSMAASFGQAVEAKADLVEGKGEKLAVYDQALDQIVENPDLAVRWNVNKLLGKKAELLGEKGELLGDSPTRTTYYDKVIRANRSPAAVADALVKKADFIRDADEKRRLREEAVARFKDSEDVDVLIAVGSAYSKLASGAVDSAEKIRLYDEIISRFGNLPMGNAKRGVKQKELRNFAVNATFDKAGLVKDGDEKIRLYDSVIGSFKGDSDSDGVMSVLRAIREKADLTNDTKEAVKEFDKIAARSGNAIVRGRALFDKAAIIEDSTEKIRIYDQVVAALASNSSWGAVDLVMKAKLAKADEVESKEQKVRIYRDVIDQSKSSKPFRGAVSGVNHAFKALIELTDAKEDKLRLQDEYLEYIVAHGIGPGGYWWGKAMMDKAAMVDDPESKIGIYDAIIEKFTLEQGGQYRNFVFDATFAKAEIMPTDAEKIRLLNSVIDEYGDGDGFMDFITGIGIQKAVTRKAEILGDPAPINEYYDKRIEQAADVESAGRLMEQKGRALIMFSRGTKR